MKWEALKQRFWWLEVSAPFLLASLVVALLTYVLYSGTRRDQLSLKIEGLLIRNSLKAAVQPPVNGGKVVIISLEESDLAELEPAPLSELRGAHISEYARILRSIGQGKPSSIMLSWVPGAHRSDQDYLAPLVEALKMVPREVKVQIPYPIDEIQFLPSTLTSVADILEGDDCGFFVQSYCTYNKKWDRWVIQSIVNQYWGTELNPIGKYHISENLPHFRPMYLLNLTSPNFIEHYSFSQILAPTFDPTILNSKAVFIGDNLAQPRTANGDNNLLRRTFLAQNDVHQSLEENGTPYHVVWALIAQMFIDKRTVAIPPQSVTITLTVILCLCILALLWKAGSPAALGIFILYSLLYPYVNNFGIRYLQTYIPMFDAIYAGLITFLFAAFGRLSYQTFLHWRLREAQSEFASTADLKKNFISLISHNLNTPVARMQGLIDVLMMQGGDDALRTASWLISYLQIGVKTILVTTAVEERSFNERAMTFAAFRDEFRVHVGSILTRIGVNVELQLSADGEQDLFVEAPMKFDGRILAIAIASGAALACQERAQVRVDVKVTAYDQKKLRLEMSSDRALSGDSMGLGQSNFFRDATMNLLGQVADAYNGRFVLQNERLALLEIVTR